MLTDLTARVAKLVEERDAIGFDVKFDIRDTGLVCVAGKESPMTVSNEDNSAELVFQIAADDLLAMLNGELNAMNAYMQGKLVVEGDLSKAMQLSSLFS